MGGDSLLENNNFRKQVGVFLILASQCWGVRVRVCIWEFGALNFPRLKKEAIST